MKSGPRDENGIRWNTTQFIDAAVCTNVYWEIGECNKSLNLIIVKPLKTNL